MKTLYFQCFAGISGDMTLGALIDIGVDFEYLVRELKKLSIADEFELEMHSAKKMGITGTKVDVILKDSGHHHEHHHEHRNLAIIKELIATSDLEPSVKKRSIDIFTEVARAEALVHGTTIEEVHFHEVGAVDSIVDIVGACICLYQLQIEKVIASTVEVGSGFVKCAHGVLPVPAPATVEILRGIKCHIGGVESEATTPTGAAILKTIATEFQDELDFKIHKIGYGMGTKDFKIPNVLRVFLLEEEEEPFIQQTMVETNIDDMSGEIFPFVEERLFEAGARDVFKTSIMMKKGRAGIMLSVLVDDAHLLKIEEILFEQTTTLGLREHAVNKRALVRGYKKINTPYGPMTIKVSSLNGKIVQIKPEFEECQKVAKDLAIPLKEVISTLNALIDKEEHIE